VRIVGPHIETKYRLTRTQRTGVVLSVRSSLESNEQWIRVTNKQSVHILTLTASPPALDINETINTDNGEPEFTAQCTIPRSGFQIKAIEEIQNNCFLVFKGKGDGHENVDLQAEIGRLQKHCSIWDFLKLKQGVISIQIPYLSGIPNWDIKFVRTACDAKDVASVGQGNSWPKIKFMQARIKNQLAEHSMSTYSELAKRLESASKGAHAARTDFKYNLENSSEEHAARAWAKWQDKLKEEIELRQIKHCGDYVNKWAPALQKQADTRKTWLGVTDWAETQGEEYWNELWEKKIRGASARKRKTPDF
jgi:hypothetical protein